MSPKLNLRCMWGEFYMNLTCTWVCFEVNVCRQRKKHPCQIADIVQEFKTPKLTSLSPRYYENEVSFGERELEEAERVGRGNWKVKVMNEMIINIRREGEKKSKGKKKKRNRSKKIRGQF